MIRTFAFATVLAFGAATMTQAATLDFKEPGVDGLAGSTVVNLSNAVLTSLDTDFFIGFGYGETNGNGIACGAAPDGTCEADWTIDFLQDVVNLMFASFATQTNDFVQVLAYFDGNLLGSVDVSSDTSVDMSAFGVIDRLVFDDRSSGFAGIGFGDFSFDAAAPIPLPATLPLALGGLAALSLVRRRPCRLHRAA